MQQIYLPTEIIRLHRVWTGIIYRCTRKENKQYKNYGGRGINICNEWMDFNQFCKDVYPCPTEGFHLDRTDNNKGYCKENCRWVSPKVNHRNKRTNRYYDTHMGKICQSELIEIIGYTKRQFVRAIEKYGEVEFLKLFEEDRLPKKRIVANILDFINKKFGRMTVISLDEDKSTGIRYFCKCDCGRPTRVSRHKLMNEKGTQCRYCTCADNRKTKSVGHKL